MRYLQGIATSKGAKIPTSDYKVKPGSVKALWLQDKPTKKVYWKDVRPEAVNKIGGHYEANGKTIFWKGKEKKDAQQALKKANFHRSRSPWQTVAGYSRNPTKKDKEKHTGYFTKIEAKSKKKLKNKTYSQLKNSGVHLNPKTDTDKDGVSNKKDCRPLDKTKQDRGRRMTLGKRIGKLIGAYAYSKTSKGRLEAANARLREVNRKEKVEEFERKARQAEQKYKSEHPSFLTRARGAIAESRRKKSIYE